MKHEDGADKRRGGSWLTMALSLLSAVVKTLSHPPHQGFQACHDTQRPPHDDTARRLCPSAVGCFTLREQPGIRCYATASRGRFETGCKNLTGWEGSVVSMMPSFAWVVAGTLDGARRSWGFRHASLSVHVWDSGVCSSAGRFSSYGGLPVIGRCCVVKMTIEYKPGAHKLLPK